MEAVTPQVTPPVAPEIQRLLRAVSEYMERTDLMQALGSSDAKHFRERYLQPALEERSLSEPRRSQRIGSCSKARAVAQGGASRSLLGPRRP